MDLLLVLTQIIDFLAFSTTLWLTFYLLGRGYPSTITLRAVVVLLALAGFFFGAFYNIFHQISGTAVIRSVLLIIGMTTWYSLTFTLLSVRARQRLGWLEWSIYALSTLTAILLISNRNVFVGEVGNILYVGRMGVGWPFALFGFTQALAAFGILFNLLTDNKIGFTPQGRYFLYASIFPILAIGYGIAALALAPPLPRLFQDGLVFCGIFLLGLSVARYQTLIERRTTIQDFPLSAITVLGLAGIYAFIAWKLSFDPEIIALAVGTAIMTHSIYDLVREFLERKRLQKESAFRKELRQLDNQSSGEEIQLFFKDGLRLLCQNLQASSGFIAINRESEFVVASTINSLAEGSLLKSETLNCDDLCQPTNLENIVWIAPAFEGDKNVVVVAIGPPENKINYSAEDLDLLTEVADHIGTVVSLGQIQPQKTSLIQQLVSEITEGQFELRSSVDTMIASIATNPPAEVVRLVEDSLRNLHDYIELGQHPLADLLEITGDSYIERGKTLQETLVAAIETLRPSGKRPPEPIPRVWYSYVVLHDAYVEDVPNREIMARLYISEGTFNRTRRSALRGLCRLLVEKGAEIA